MPQIEPSPPFNLARHDWVDLGKKLLYAIAGATVGFMTATGLPTLKEHTSNDLGVLIVTVLSALVPFLLQMAQKYLTDTTKVVKLVLLALTLSLVPSSLFAAEAFGVTTGPTGSVITDLFANLTKDPLLMVAVIIGGLLLASKVLHIDLSGILPIIIPILTALLKPPGPAPTPTPTPMPGPTPTPAPTPTDPTAAILQLLVSLLTQARTSGDKQTEDATFALLSQISAKK